MASSSLKTVHLTFSPYHRHGFFERPNESSLLLTIFDLIGPMNHLQYHEIAVMPDHIHMLFSYENERDIAHDIVRKIKGISSRYFRKITKAQEPYLWTRGHYHVFIRSEKQFNTTLSYIQKNPREEKLDPSPRLLSKFLL